MKIAVTAASGKLGAEIVKALVGLLDADQVVGLARTVAKAEHLGVEIRSGDYEQPDQLKDSLHGIDSLLVVSGMDAPEKRIQQHRNVIDSAKFAGVSKLVYTSIQGSDDETAFSPIVQSNRQTEEDVRQSGLAWVIGRNGIYIEPDIEYIDKYVEQGEIANCAGEGRCGYTTRPELAYAYAKMLTEDQHHGQTYNLHGTPITQQRLVEYMNQYLGTKLVYRAMTVEEYRAERIAELGEFMGTVISGIYEGIRNGEADRPSDYLAAAGREHLGWDDYFKSILAS